MKALLQQLKGGDRRSIGASQRVVEQVLTDASLFPIVFDGLKDVDELVRMRCADAVEKITVVHPEYLTPYKKQIIRLAAEAEQQEIRWHLAQLFSRLKLNASERQQVLGILSAYLTDQSRIVKTFSMQALADLAEQDHNLREPILKQLEELTRTGSPAMKSRGRKLLARLNQPHRKV